MYRITSDLFPFADDPLGEPVLAEFAEPLARIGRLAGEQGLRLVLHPDQFVVLSSDTPDVVANSRRILAHHARVLDLLEQPRTPWAAIELHGGKRGRAPQLVAQVQALPEAVRGRLVLENDERCYGAAEILAVCREAGVPMVFDAHHHVVREGLDSYDHPSVALMLAEARTTWPEPTWQMVHISNGRERFGDPRHSDLITTMPAAFAAAPWIEVEAKLKEEAIAKLQREWPPT